MALAYFSVYLLKLPLNNLILHIFIFRQFYNVYGTFYTKLLLFEQDLFFPRVFWLYFILFPLGFVYHFLFVIHTKRWNDLIIEKLKGVFLYNYKPSNQETTRFNILS